jgi:NTP pyrophosphatase (non-canonical NTP hydrolase)
MIKISEDPLTLADTELLVMLMEEAAEVQQAIAKVLRHGFYSYHPDDLEQKTNRELLEKELADVFTVHRMLTDANVLREVTEKDIHDTCLRKIVWTHYQEPEGVEDDD